MKKSRSSSPEHTAETTTSEKTTSSSSGGYSSMLPTSFTDKRWFKTASLLRADPSLMTSKILILALKNNAPLHVIKFFLNINTNAAGIPKEGPTPLQVAVQCNASKEVIKELLQACPFALIVTTSAEWLDPLSYARRHRSEETELIALLSRPLGSWIHPAEREEAERKESQAKRNPPPVIPIPISLTPVSDSSSRVPPPTARTVAGKPRGIQSPFAGADKQELQNVKQLCLTVMKGQKRLVREVSKVKNSLQTQPSLLTMETEAGVEAGVKTVPIQQGHEVTLQDVKDLEERQKKHLKAHLIALDMKEQSMRAYVSRMENKLLESLELSKQEYDAQRYEEAVQLLRDQLNNAGRRMDEFIGSVEHRMADFEVRMDHEAKVNCNFRTGVAHHLEISQQDVSQQEGFEVISIVENTPFVFATPYRKPVVEDATPLCPKGLVDEKPPGACVLWPKLFRRRDPKPVLD